MENSFLGHIKVLKKAMESGKLVVFAGAGVSRDAGIPTWSELVQQLATDIDLPEKDSADALRVAQIYYNQRGEKEYVERVREILKHKKAIYQPTHELILKLSPEHIFTTNFDNLFEQVIQGKAYPYSIISKDSDFPYALNTSLLVKVHGDLDDTKIVLKEDDFIDYSEAHPLIESFIKSAFASKVVLFVGYSFSDPNLKAIIHQVRHILGGNFQHAYLFSTEENVHDSQIEYLKKKGVIFLSYKDYIKDFLKGNNYLRKDYYKDFSISGHGQKLCEFLTFLAEFNPFYEQLQDKCFVDQLYDSLMRFKDITTLDPVLLTKIFPINFSDNYNYIQGSTLYTDNKHMIKLFFDDIKIIDNEFIEIINTDSVIGNTNEKIQEIIKVFNFGGLTRIGNNRNATAGFSEKHVYLALNQGTCNCLGCRYLRFEFASILAEIADKPTLNPNQIGANMLLGYINYKFGAYETCIKIFTETASHAWLTDKHMLYYLSKKNIKTMHNLIKWPSSGQSEQKQLLEIINDIDDEKILQQMVGLTPDEFSFVKRINTFEQLSDFSNKIRKKYDGIFEQYMETQNGARYRGTNKAYEVLFDLHKMFLFYWNNNIVIDNYTDFLEPINIAFNALIICLSPQNSKKNTLETIDSFLFKLMVLYGETKKMDELFATYKVSEIPIDNDELEKVINLASNFLSSYYGVYEHFKGPFANYYTEQQLRFKGFEESSGQYFSNFFMLLSRIIIDKEQFLKVVGHLTNFLEVVDFIKYTDTKYVANFLYKNRNHLNVDLLDKLIFLVLQKERVFYRDGCPVAESLGAIINEHFSDYEYKYGKRVVSFFSSIEQVKLYGIVDFYNFVDADSKASLAELMVKTLTEKFDYRLYLEIVHANMIGINEFFDQYLDTVPKSIKIEVRNGEAVWQDVRFVDFVQLVYIKQLPLSDAIIERFSQSPDFMRVAISPKDFDYNNFKTEWLSLYRHPEIMKKLSKISGLKRFLKQNIKQSESKLIRDLYIEYFN